MTTPLEQLREACANELDEEIAQIRSYDKYGAMRNICGALVVVRDRIRAIDLTQFERGEAPKWNYSGHPSPDKDCRKLVTLHQGNMWWIGIRAWNSQGKFWQNGNDPEAASVHAWMDLPDIARSFWDKGVLIDMDSQFQKIADKQEEK